MVHTHRSLSTLSSYLNHLMVLCFALTIFLIPSNLFVKFFSSTAYVNGLQVDYLLPKLYASDISIIGLLILWGVEGVISWQKDRQTSFQQMKQSGLKQPAWGIFLILFILLGCRQFWTPKPDAAVWFWFKLVEMFSLVEFLLHHSALVQSKVTRLMLPLSLVFYSLIGWYQFQTQHSLFSSYLFLGEPNLSHRIGLAKGTFNGVEKILPYSTTPHPNILAGVIVTTLLTGYLLGIIRLIPKKADSHVFHILGSWIVTLISLTVLYWTQSASAWLGLGVGVAGLWLVSIRPQLSRWVPVVIGGGVMITVPVAILFLAQVFPASPSLVRRAELSQAAGQMVIAQPLLGVGLNNFTTQVEKYHPSTEAVRFVQPAHHVFLLWIAETGILGISVILSILTILYSRMRLTATHQWLWWLASLAPLASLDHYLLSQQTGLLILSIFGTMAWISATQKTPPGTQP